MNGNFISHADIRVGIYSYSLHYGNSVWEGIRCYNGKLFKLKQHIQRLIVSAAFMGLDLNFNVDDLCNACEEVVKRNGLVNAYLRPLVWSGDQIFGIAIDLSPADVCILPYEIPQKFFSGEIGLLVSNWRRQDSRFWPAQCKGAGMYAIHSMAARNAKSMGYQGVVLLDGGGMVAECATSNIFFVEPNGTVVSPGNHAALDGITKNTVIEICDSLNIKVSNQDIAADELENFTECFMTGTALEVTPVNYIMNDNNKIVFPQNKIGSLLRKKYLDLVNQL